MIKEGFDCKILKTLGSPAYDRLQHYKYTRLIEGESLKVIFLSQPFKEYGEVFTQVDILEDYINEIEKEYSIYDIDIKLHPNEEVETWKKYFNSTSIDILKHKPEEDTIKTCLDYDLVIGYNSTVQLQTLLLNIPTIFYDKDIRKYIKEFKKSGVISQFIPYKDFNLNSLGGCIKFIKELIK